MTTWFAFRQGILNQNSWLDSAPKQNAQLYLMAKRIMDVVLVLYVLPLVALLMALCAILIKLEDPKGPIFFIQQRTGKGGKRFGMYKFRTMVYNAEELKASLAHLNELEWPDFKVSNDPRVTRIGRILRKTSLDELPQLLNVLRGEMSLVGPRPEREYFINKIVERAPVYTQLLKVKPGITSWGQVKYGYAENVDQMIKRMKYDLLYLENMSLYVDFKILIYTANTILKGTGI